MMKQGYAEAVAMVSTSQMRVASTVYSVVLERLLELLKLYHQR
jgi:hypothetical protein